MRSAIHLPVVERLRVLNYPLYPGSNKQGLDLAFDKGVSVIAGINGIGKTTLLNLLLRMLVGPTNPAKSARDMGLVSSRSLVTAKKFGFFQDRAGVVLQPNATATLTFRIGGKQVTVTRRLTNLEITKLLIGGRTVDTPDPQGFLALMAELSGLANAYDFHMVVRYVQFFTEERLPLLWSPTAQLELFKMLFVDEKIGQSLNKLYSDIQGVDTDYRNRTYQYNQRKDRYELARAQNRIENVDLDDVRGKLAAASVELQEINRSYKTANDHVTSLVSQREEIDRRIESLLISLDQETHAFHHQDAAFIAQALPSLDDKFQMLMQGLGSNLGCFVCGKGGKREVENISKRLREQHCFVCNTSLVKTKNSNVVPITAKVLQKIEQKVESLRLDIGAQQRSLQDQDQAYAAALTNIRPIVAKRHELMMRVEQLNAQLPVASDDAQTPLLADLEAERLALDALAEKRADLGVKYKRQIDKLTLEMSALESDLGNRLQRYAEQFLHESVSVKFTRNHRFKVATGAAQVNLPTFRIAMTSSTHLAVHDRFTATSVSESQKEFLDLAFRMTLLDMVADDGATMLVMETPEASLDSWFMARAAQMIRKFSPEEGKRLLIATSNVNGTTMIPALLGLVSNKGTVRKLPKAKHSRLIDLMKLAEEPGVLKDDEAKQKLSSELRSYLGS
ncbi:AAA family ATPase [Lysobacter yananisis]|uniref:AAA family ATPase n=1 Tax=Lysobacter yananisis TaxID=1003114 RepID=A0ABY9PFQ6_9GAMM|nr:AAA family ATPase [Lysobacter yananisis]WMT05716.1 AAA family ATPase [Lysobacter yananisis]